jgi:hypothetical protein
MYTLPSLPGAPVATDRNTYVNANWFALDPSQQKGLIAHEEVHHRDEDDEFHSLDIAYPRQRLCASS